MHSAPPELGIPAHEAPHPSSCSMASASSQLIQLHKISSFSCTIQLMGDGRWRIWLKASQWDDWRELDELIEGCWKRWLKGAGWREIEELSELYEGSQKSWKSKLSWVGKINTRDNSFHMKWEVLVQQWKINYVWCNLMVQFNYQWGSQIPKDFGNWSVYISCKYHSEHVLQVGIKRRDQMMICNWLPSWSNITYL
jgi:hypothetical protein